MSLPSFHRRPVCSVARWTALLAGNETRKVAALPDAIDACAAAGGGRVRVSAGRWLTTPIVRTSRGKHFALGRKMPGGVRKVFSRGGSPTGDMNTIRHLKTRCRRGGIVENITAQDLTAGRVSAAVSFADRR